MADGELLEKLHAVKVLRQERFGGAKPFLETVLGDDLREFEEEMVRRETRTIEEGLVAEEITVAFIDGLSLGQELAAPEGEFLVPLTRGQIDILRSITGPRVDAGGERYGDWSVDLDRRLRKAIE